jgi:hypothetical protein
MRKFTFWEKNSTHFYDWIDIFKLLVNCASFKLPKLGDLLSISCHTDWVEPNHMYIEKSVKLH